MSKAEDLAGLLDANGDVLATNLDNVSVAFADLTGKPTTISGYGITDAFDGTYSSLTGAPTAVSSFTNDSGYATTTYVDGEIADLVASAPATLDTLNELAAALGDDANFSTTVTNSIATKAALSGADFTGNVTTTGNVGIGTTSPSSDAGLSRILQVGSATDTSTTIVLKDDDGDFELGSAGGSFRVYDDGLERMRIDASGHLLIGKTTNDFNTAGIALRSEDVIQVARSGGTCLDVNRKTSDGAIINIAKDGTVVGSIGTSSGDLTVVSASDLKFYTSTSNEDMRLETDGDLHVDGDVIAYSTTISDERLKTNIQGIENAVAKVGQLNGYTFEYKADGKISAGVIAQEVEQVLPEAVSEKQLPLKTDDDQDYKVVNYDALHGLLIEAIKELSARVEALEAK